MKRRPSGGGGSRGGASSDEKLAGFFNGILRRCPWLPKLVLWLVGGLVLMGLILSFL